MFDFSDLSDLQIIRFVMSSHSHMRNTRLHYEPLWDVITQIYRPRRYDMLRQDQPGQQYGARVYDGHPQNVANKASNGLIGYMMSRQVPWLAFGPTRAEFLEIDEVKQYFQEAAEQILHSFTRSTFYDSADPFVKDGMTIGTAVMMPEEDLTEGRIIYETVHPGSSWIADDKFGRAAVYHREQKMTATQAADMFGKDNLPGKIAKNLDLTKGTANPFAESTYLMAMYKNDNWVIGSVRPENMKYRVFWIATDVGNQSQKKLLVNSGSNTFPVVWRPGKEPTRPYGTSIAADALTEALIGNKLGEKQLVAVHKAVDPPTWAPKTLRGNVNTGPGGRTWYNDPTERVEELQSRLAWPLSDAQMERIHQSLDDKFSIRLYEMLTGQDLPQMTAFQVSRMRGELAVLLGGVVGSFGTDALESGIDIQWDFETRAGRMPDVPQILQDETDGIIDIQFLGPLAQLQRSTLESKGILDGIAIAAEIAQTWPASVIKVNAMETMEDALLAQGFPQKNINNAEQVQEILDAEAEARAEQQQAEQLVQAADAVPKLSKPVEEGSPLAALAGAA